MTASFAPQVLRYAELPFGNCSHCGCRFEVGLSPFCSLRCERAHTDKVMGRGYSALVRNERAARARREAVQARKQVTRA
jgi:hypothetical protein